MRRSGEDVETKPHDTLIDLDLELMNSCSEAKSTSRIFKYSVLETASGRYKGFVMGFLPNRCELKPTAQI